MNKRKFILAVMISLIRKIVDNKIRVVLFTDILDLIEHCHFLSNFEYNFMILYSFIKITVLSAYILLLNVYSIRGAK